MEAGRLVAKAVEGCVSASQAATEDAQLLRGVGAAATAVTQALNELLQHVRAHAIGAGPAGRYDQATDTILTVTENIFSSMGDAGKNNSSAHTLWGSGEAVQRGALSQLDLLYRLPPAKNIVWLIWIFHL